MKTERYRDPVVEVYMRDVDRTLLRENLKLTYEQRALKHAKAMRLVGVLQRSGKLDHSWKHLLKTTEDVFQYAARHGIRETMDAP